MFELLKFHVKGVSINASIISFVTSG